MDSFSLHPVFPQTISLSLLIRFWWVLKPAPVSSFLSCAYKRMITDDMSY